MSRETLSLMCLLKESLLSTTMMKFLFLEKEFSSVDKLIGDSQSDQFEDKAGYRTFQKIFICLRELLRWVF